ncbi:MAG: AMP-binding protein, partial [Gammaproteobacteria bacterium]|nr:AMP-binding protein [Gammaproteobacteria bacterium]
MEKIWLKSYPEGVPAEIDPGRYRSLVHMLDESVARYRDRPAFCNMGRVVTYGELDRLTRDFAAFLQAECGLGKGERLAIMTPNLLQYPVALFGGLRAGATIVNVNPLYTARELAHQLADAEVGAIVILENFGHVLEECLGRVPVPRVITTRLGDMLGRPRGWLVDAVVKHVKGLVPPYRIAGEIRFPAALARGRAARFTPVELGHDDLAFLQYTGGTTGTAKGAMLSHRNMLANVEQATAWLSPIIEPGEEIIITALPLYHVFALTANCLTFVRIGGLNFLITNPRDMRGFVKSLQGVRFTGITGVNTLFNGLLNTRGFAELDFSPLKMALGGGAAVQRAVAERWKQVTGVTLVEAYGLTETAPAVCINPMDLAQFNGSIGLPISSTECCIRDERGSELPIGEVGELCVRGPQVMAGYWRSPEETRACLDDDGWLRTGDIARMDERGFVYIVDRKKDMINVSGFNVYPNEIEAVVAAHPDVLEAGAIGVPDGVTGEAVKIIVVKRSPALTRESLDEHCRTRLTAYKRPSIVEFATEL